VPSTTRISGAGTVSGDPISPNASTCSAGPDGPSGLHCPAAARSASASVPRSTLPARRVLSLGSTIDPGACADGDAVAGYA